MGPSDIPNQVWTDIVLGKNNYQFQFLAVNMLLVRLRMKVRHDQSPANVQSCVVELKNLFVKYGHLPLAQKDLGEIQRNRRQS